MDPVVAQRVGERCPAARRVPERAELRGKASALARLGGRRLRHRKASPLRGSVGRCVRAGRNVSEPVALSVLRGAPVSLCAPRLRAFPPCYAFAMRLPAALLALLFLVCARRHRRRRPPLHPQDPRRTRSARPRSSRTSGCCHPTCSKAARRRRAAARWPRTIWPRSWPRSAFSPPARTAPSSSRCRSSSRSSSATSR